MQTYLKLPFSEVTFKTKFKKIIKFEITLNNDVIHHHQTRQNYYAFLFKKLWTLIMMLLTKANKII